MALVVEDGTGLANAESYLSVADYKVQCDSLGYTYPADADASIEQGLRRGTRWLDATYSDRLPGTRLRGRAQSLQWPRADVVDREGEDVPSDAVPAEIKMALVEATRREIAAPNSLSPDVVAGKIKKSVAISGAVSVTYADSSISDQRPTLTVVGDILAPLLNIPRGSTGIVWLNRG